MRKYLRQVVKLFALYLVSQATFSTSSSAQTILNRRDFILFGDTVQLSSSSTITGLSTTAGVIGSVGAKTLIKTTGSISFPNDLHSGGKIEFTNGNIIPGKTTAANFKILPPFSGNTLATGTGGSFGGDILVNGNINIGNYTVASGKIIYQPTGATYAGPTTATRQTLSLSQLPTLPVMPANSNIVPSTSSADDIKNSATLYPASATKSGKYRDIILGGNKTITFDGPGVYMINSITLTNSNTFTFNFKNSTSGKFIILVKGNMLLDKAATSILNGPTGTTANATAATRIYIEVQGSGGTIRNSFQIANGSSSSMARCLGTVWAPNGNISIGSGTGGTNITGAFWSGKQVIINSGVNVVYSPLVNDCLGTTAMINGGAASADIPCTETSIQLTGSTTVPNPIYSWSTLDNKGNILSTDLTASNITVTTAGKYILTVTNADGCKAADTISVTSCVNGAVDGNPLKVYTIVDGILFSLLEYPNFINTPDLFIFNDPVTKSKVLIEVILKDNTLETATAALNNVLIPNGFDQTFISNSTDYYIITGFYPRDTAKIALLENNTYFKYVRAVTPPIGLSANPGGSYITGGDSAIGSRSARKGYDITGAQYKSKDGTTKPIKIGVISDSYNKKDGVAAQNDIDQGELPAIPLSAIHDYPFPGDKTDEGRAMMQIIHEQAPGAQLSFSTGFISEGDMAQRIRQLRDEGCNIIVDDITYATTPFFRDGLVTKAIKEVVADSVLYFTSAGNFSNKSYEGKFSASLPYGSAVPIPGATAPGTLQRLEVSKAGSYMVILQWDDDFYSVNEPGITKGADYDVDIYLTDYTGKNILGYNRVNTGSDPLEILPFTVTDKTTVYLKVVVASGPVPQRSGDISYKYILFRGSGKILDDANAFPTTIIGHANSNEAMTVGAVEYNLTPAYGVAANLVKVEPFSSWGGTTKGIASKKPDFTAPDGVNTSVVLGNLGLIDINGAPWSDPDHLPGLPYNNFFGTSAAAPHAAGLAALLLEARWKYNPGRPAFGYQSLKSVFQNTALNIETASDIDATGFDYKSGYGMLDGYKALLTEANPKPRITSIKSLTTTNTPDGKVQINVVADGNYLVNTSYIVVDNVTYPTTVNLATKTLTAIIDPFIGNPEVKVCSPSIATGDGQCSDPINILDASRTKVTVRAKPYNKVFGAPLPPDANAPPFKYELLIGDDPTIYDPYNPNLTLPNGLTLRSLGLSKAGLQAGDPDISTVHLSTAASPTADAGSNQTVHPSVEGFDPTIPLEYAKLYDYKFVDAALIIEKLKVTITPDNQIIKYGDEIGPVTFKYTTPGTTNVDPTVIEDIKTEHTKWIANGYALVKGFDVSKLTDANMAIMITETGLNNANAGATRANGGATRANVVDVSPDALNYYIQNRLTNGGATRANGIPYDNAATRANAGATRANGGATRANTIVNADAIINGFIVVSSNGGATRANVSGGDPNANGGATRANGGVSRANYITFTANGGATRANVVLNSDPSKTEHPFADLTLTQQNTISVNAYPNSDITNGIINSGGQDISLVNSSLFTANSNSNVAVLMDDADIDQGFATGYISINMVTGLTATNGVPHLIIPGAFLPLNNNYDITYGTGNLVVNKSPMTVTADNKSKIYGEPVDFSSTVTGYVYNPETDAIDDATVFQGGITYDVSKVDNSIVVPVPGPIYPVYQPGYTIKPLFTEPANYDVTPDQGSNGVLTIGKAEQTITWSNPGNIVYGTLLGISQLNAIAKGVTGGSNPGELTYSPLSGALLTAGTHTLRVDAAATNDYNAAFAEVTINVDKADQTITVTTPSPASAVFNSTFTVAATASSGLPVAYTSSAPLSNNGTLYTMNTGSGTGKVRYNQPGNENYNPAPEVVVDVTAGKADQTITVTTASPISAVYNTGFTVAATASSGLAVNYSSTAPLTNTGSTFTMNSGTGTGKVRYNQPGNENYNPAPEVVVDVAAAKANQTITVTTPSPSNAVYGSSFTVAANASSGLPIIYSSTAPLINSGSVFTMKAGTGTAVVKYNQPGDNNYNPAPEITANVGASKANLSISMGQQVYYFTTGGTLPSFSSTITGLVSGDNIPEQYVLCGTTTVIASSLAAGTYQVCRSIPSSILSNYIVSNPGATLYVNPSGGNTKAIRPTLVCVEQIGTDYRAKYSWQNDNSVDVYVPLGDDNKIILSPGAVVQAGNNPPVLFTKNSTGVFYITFNGIKITWYLASIEKNKKTSSTSDASSTSGKCASGGGVVNNLLREATTDIATHESIYPNPANGQVFIEGDFSRVSENNVIIVDMLGHQVRPAGIQKLSSRKMKIDIGNLAKSQYFITVYSSTGRKVFKFIKQ